MKAKLMLSAILSFSFYLVSSQIPQGFNYQAIVRDASNEIIAGKNMTVTIALHANSGTGTLLWEETNAVTSNQFGLVSFVVGDGFRTGGLPLFTDIDWNAQTVFLKTTVEYPSGTFTVMGTTQIWAVPYSLVAKDLEGPVEVDKIGITGTTTNDEEALFEVKNKDGQIIFAVYNEGVRIYVNDIDSKGAKGGFAIGGFGSTKTIPHEYLFISGDSVRVYIDNGDADKGAKGGFAIGGFGAVKGLDQNFLTVSNDSVRIYIDNKDSDKGAKGGFAIGGYGAAKGKPQDLLTVSNESVKVFIDQGGTDKGAKGGFAIGGFGAAKGASNFLNVTPDSTRIFTGDSEKGFGVGNIATGASESYLKLTPQNYFIGHEAGKKNVYNQIASTGDKNIFIGYQAGQNNISGRYNTFLGYQAGLTNSGSDNTFIGYKAGNAHRNMGGNVYIGSKAGEFAIKGEQNVLIGESVGAYISTGKQNIMMGVSAGKQDTSGSNNVFLGYNAAKNNTTGNSNVIVGNESGMNHREGDFNTFIGYQSGYNNYTAKENVFLGYQTGYENNGYDNVFIGYMSGKNNKSGHHNVFLGAEAGLTNDDGMNNIFIGAYAGKKNESGSANIILGLYAGRENIDGSENLFFGNMAGNQNTLGNSNIFMGYRAGLNNLTGNFNIYLGYDAGNYGTSAKNSIILGKNAGFVNQADSNIFIGSWAGNGAGTGVDNILIGSGAGMGHSAGDKNIILGYKTGYQSYNGENNIMIGTEAGYNNISDNNIFLGYNAGFSNSNGNSNILIGQNAGKANTTGINNTIIGNNAASGSSFIGTGNVIIGNLAGSLEASTVNKLFIDNSGTATPLIWGDFTDGSEKLAFNAKVGIGTNNPSESMETSGSDSKIFMNSTNSNMVLFNDQGVAAPSISSRSNGTKLVLHPKLTGTSSDFALGIETNALWYSVPEASSTYSLKFYGGQTELFRIRGDGNLGIGTNDPGQKLEIGGYNSQIFMNSFNSNLLRFNQYGDGLPAFTTRSPGTKVVLYDNISGSTTDYAFGIYSGSLWYSVPYANLSYSHNFYAGTTELMTIRGDKKVGIGISSPAYNLDVTGNGRYTTDLLVGGTLGIGGAPSFYDFRLVKSTSYFIASFENTGATNASEGINILAGSNTGGPTGANFIQFTKPADSGLPDVEIIGSIHQDGSDAVKYSTTSDRRRKENIVDTHFGLDNLMKIQVRDFEFISDPENKLNTGFIAQELYEVYPDAVTKPANENGLWQVDYGRITPLLVKAIQDQEIKIQKLEERNLQLETKVKEIDYLKARLLRVEELLSK